MRGRYAPSPSGDLHLGNARTALLAWWHTRSLDGTFVLRMEDLDPDRSKKEAADGIIEDLRWLGVDWDEGPDVGGPYGPYLQSERYDRYAEALRTLAVRRRVYACTCTRSEVRAAASAPHGRPAGAVRYPGTCRPKSADQWASLRSISRSIDTVPAGERVPSLRFAVADEPIRFVDAFAGEQCATLADEFGDFIVRRSDGVAAYHLAVAVDDAEQRITHVLRGDDLLRATACQIGILRELGLPVPQYAHVPLVVDAGGRRLAKRRGDMTLRALRAGGAKPEAIVGYLAWTCGLLEKPVDIRPQELVDGFSLDRVKKEPAAIEPETVSALL